MLFILFTFFSFVFSLSLSLYLSSHSPYLYIYTFIYIYILPFCFFVCLSVSVSLSLSLSPSSAMQATNGTSKHWTTLCKKGNAISTGGSFLRRFVTTVLPNFLCFFKRIIISTPVFQPLSLPSSQGQTPCRDPAEGQF